MNKQLQKFAREQLKLGLSKCSEKEQIVFKRMYAHDKMGMEINDVVDKMDESRLDWAMQQVESTLKKKQMEIRYRPAGMRKA